METENGEVETVIIEKEETMIIPNGGKPSKRISQFLNPSVTSVTQAAVPSLKRMFRNDDGRSKWQPSKIQFKGWKNPQRKWEPWINQLVPSKGFIWNQAMICDAIASSIYKIEIDKELILGLLDFWCFEMNTFVFPWGEATITLEDMVILGGFPVLGEPVTCPLTGDLLKISDGLEKEHKALYKQKAKKPSEGAWTDRFMGRNSELEHVAFLSLWLSRYVFPDHPDGVIIKQVFPVAIHLAQGKPLALAPAVLTSLYNNFTSLKNQVLESKSLCPSISVWGPFQFLQVWAWGHFPLLRPGTPNSLNPGEPRIARWRNLKSKSKLSDVRSILKCSENFQWRPYVATINYWRCPLFYKGREELNDVRADDDELQSFFRCLRACEIFGLDGLIELYLPHRVARQFGYDQDLPGQMSRVNSTWESAWIIYAKSTKDPKVYIRSQFLEANVTLRYQEWWKQSMSLRQDSIRDMGVGKTRFKSCASKSDCSAASKCSETQSRPESPDLSDEDDKLTLSIKFNLIRHNNPPRAIPTSSTTCIPSESLQIKKPMGATMSEVNNKKRTSDTQHEEKNVKSKVVKKSVGEDDENKKKIGDSIYNPLTVDDYEEGTVDKPIYLDD